MKLSVKECITFLPKYSKCPYRGSIIPRVICIYKSTYYFEAKGKQKRVCRNVHGKIVNRAKEKYWKRWLVYNLKIPTNFKSRSLRSLEYINLYSRRWGLRVCSISFITHYPWVINMKECAHNNAKQNCFEDLTR